MFGQQKPKGNTILLLDIENGSIGAGLAYLEKGSQPVMYAEQRTPFSVPHNLYSDSILKEIEKATHRALSNVAVTAARMRTNPAQERFGTLGSTATFLGAPWGVPNVNTKKSDFLPYLQQFVTKEMEAIANGIPHAFYTNAEAAVHGSAMLRPSGVTLLAVIRGEITELILLGEQGMLGYATVPVGAHTLHRTLRAHAGVSRAEIPAILSLTKNSVLHPYHEALSAAEQYVLEQIAPSIEALTHNGEPQSLIIIAEEPFGSWFARTLEKEGSLSKLFAKDAVIRTLGSTHAAQYLQSDTRTPDLHIGLAALFAHGKQHNNTGTFISV